MTTGLKLVLFTFPEKGGHPKGYVPGSLFWSARSRKLRVSPRKGPCTFPSVMSWAD